MSVEDLFVSPSPYVDSFELARGVTAADLFTLWLEVKQLARDSDLPPAHVGRVLAAVEQGFVDGLRWPEHRGRKP